MIDLTRVQISHFAAHHVGNKGLGELLTLTDNEIKFRNDFNRDTMLQYLTSKFKSEALYRFQESEQAGFVSINVICNELFNDVQTNGEFMVHSHNIANKLYDTSLHPKVKGGELYVLYLKDCLLNNQLCDAIGIFKSESVDTFIKVDIENGTDTIEPETGYALDNLDKGCLIFNIDKENGYSVAIHDKNKVAELGFYWHHDFLGLKIKQTPWLTTTHAINQCVAFCEEVLTQENNVNIHDQRRVLNNSVKHFGEKTEYVQDEFEKEVLSGNKEIVDAFREHKQQFSKNHDCEIPAKFEINPAAVKAKKKFTTTKIALDNNFSIEIASRHDLIEQGYDDAKEMKFYKVYYVNDSIK